MKLETCGTKFVNGKTEGYFLRQIPENGEYAGKYITKEKYEELTGEVKKEIPIMFEKAQPEKETIAEEAPVIKKSRGRKRA